MATRYHFITTIELASDRSQVWTVLQDAETWPDWWRWLRAVELIEEGEHNGVGSVIRNEVSTPLGYRLRYDGRTTTSVEPSLVEFDVSGDLVGTGQFRLTTIGEDATRFSFNWLVETPKWWMNLTAPIARPVFSWNHDRLMSDFAEGLASALGTPLGSVRNESLSPGDPGFFVLPPVE